MRRSPRLLRPVLLSLVALAVCGGLVVLAQSKGMNSHAERFFRSVQQGQLGEACTHLSATLRAPGEEAWLRTLLSDTEILDAQKSAWTEHRSSNGYGELEGSVTRKEGEVIPITMLFVREGVDWKLYAIRRPFTGELPQPIEPPLPNAAERITLVKRAIQDFAASVRTRDMSYFRSTLAPSRQERYTTAHLDQAFQRFFDMPEDLSSLEGVEPRVDAPAPTETPREVTLSGYFDTAPKHVVFQQKYCYEKSDWRLLSFKIEMQ